VIEKVVKPWIDFRFSIASLYPWLQVIDILGGDSAWRKTCKTILCYSL